MNQVKTNVPGWVKDTDTGVIINTNKSQLDNLKAQRKKNKQIEALESEVQIVKTMMLKICEKLGISDV